MWSILKFILKFIADFMSMLFTIDLDNGLSIGLLLCICFIMFPIVLRIINFIKQDAVEELNSDFENQRGLFAKKEYIGKHEFTGRHSKQYFERQKRIKKLRGGS